MIGLLVKDFRLLKNQAKFFIMVFAIGAFLMVGNSDPFYVVWYVTFVCAFSAMNVIAYDEMENGFSFLFTLPISKKEYVIEKYIFSVLFMGISTIASFILLMGYLLKENKLESTGKYLFQTIGFVLVLLFFLSIILAVLS